MNVTSEDLEMAVLQLDLATALSSTISEEEVETVTDFVVELSDNSETVMVRLHVQPQCITSSCDLT